MKQNLESRYTMEAGNTCKNVYYTLCTSLSVTPHLHTTVIHRWPWLCYIALGGTGQKRNTQKWDGGDTGQRWKMTGQFPPIDDGLVAQAVPVISLSCRSNFFTFIRPTTTCSPKNAQREYATVAGPWNFDWRHSETNACCKFGERYTPVRLETHPDWIEVQHGCKVHQTTCSNSLDDKEQNFRIRLWRYGTPEQKHVQHQRTKKKFMMQMTVTLDKIS